MEGHPRGHDGWIISAPSGAPPSPWSSWGLHWPSWAVWMPAPPLLLRLLLRRTPRRAAPAPRATPARPAVRVPRAARARAGPEERARRASKCRPEDAVALRIAPEAG